MSGDFVNEHRVDLKSLYQLKNAVESLGLDLLEVWFEQRQFDDNAAEGWLADLRQACKLGEEELSEQKERFNRLFSLLRQNTPQHTSARNLYGALETFAKRRKEKACEPPNDWQNEFDALLRDIVGTLTELKVIRLRWDAIPYDDLVDVERLFSEEVYEYLPFEARQDFQEAGRCFLFEQYKAAVMLSFRAAERVAKEYYQRIAGTQKARTFGAIHTGLLNKPSTPLASVNVLNWIQNTGNKRNEFMHSTEKNSELKPSTAKSHVNLATGLCSALVDDLRERNKLLAVAVEEPIDFDQALTLWLLDKEGGGIGRKDFFRGRRREEKLDMHDLQYKIGGVEGTFKRPPQGSPGCIARRMKKDLKLGKAYTLLVRFAARMRHKTGPIVESDSPAETLEELSETLQHLDQASSDDYLSEAWKLFDAILEGGLKPSDPHLAKSLPSDFSSLVDQARQRLESEAEETRETEYDGQGCLLIETRRPKSNEEYGQRGFPYVIVRDGSSFHVRVNFFGTGKPNWLPILKQVSGDFGFKLTQDQRQLLSKEPLPGLSLDKMKEVVEAAELVRADSV